MGSMVTLRNGLDLFPLYRMSGNGLRGRSNPRQQAGSNQCVLMEARQFELAWIKRLRSQKTMGEQNQKQ
jgi:hypothetical protein